MDAAMLSFDAVSTVELPSMADGFKQSPKKKAAEIIKEPMGKKNVDPDEALVARAKDGDSRAFEALVVKHQHAIIGLCNKMVGEADGEDIAQLVFLRVHRALKGFKGDSQFYTWVYRIAINSCKNHLSARNCRPALQDIDIADAELFGHTEQLSDIDTPERQLLSEEIKEKVMQVIAKMPKFLRQAVSLREFEGMSYEEMAEVMNVPVGTVRSRLFRAREMIDHVLEPLLA